MKFLVNTVETYRVPTEKAASELIEEAKSNGTYTLIKYSSQKRVKKAQGEIEDEWYRVTLWKEFNEEKEPISEVEISYEVK